MYIVDFLVYNITLCYKVSRQPYVLKVSKKNEISYTPACVARRFHLSNKFVRGLMGPLGSGKTVSCVMELFRKSIEQLPSRQGRRRTRWAVIRNTYRELIDTTLKIFFEWVPKEMGHWSKMDMQFTLYATLADGTEVEAEFLFRALDRPIDVKKVLSLNLTGAFINEGREVPLVIVEAVSGRCGRFPSMKDGGPTWHGLIMDTNPPDNDHWWYNLFEELQPENHALFKQPSGVSLTAENKQNLPPRYYENLMMGKNQEWINVYVHGMYGFVSDGKPVYPEYNDGLHYSDHYTLTWPFPKGARCFVGIDFGLTPAAAIGVVLVTGQVVVLDELCTFDCGAVSFGRLLREKLDAPPWRGRDFEIYGDPAGDQRSQADENTPFLVLQEQGIDAFPTYTNDPVIRREVVAGLLSRLVMSGQPAMVVGPGAPMIRKGFGGGYKYKRIQVTGEARFIDKPDKNRFSHVSEALQYGCLGIIGDEHVIGGFGKAVPDYSKHDRSIV